MLLALATLASAATVAVLDFDGYGVGFADAQTVTQAVRDAFLGEGLLDPLSGSDIAEGAAKGQDAGLRRARERVAEARRRCDGGDPAGAAGPLLEAIALHDVARSDVGRRPELADAWYLHAVCLQQAGREAEARAAFVEVAWLHPRYGRERAASPPAAAQEALRAAEDGLARAPRRIRPAAEVGEIGAALGVDFVVTGAVEADGRVKTRLYAKGRLLGEAGATLAQIPPLPVDDAYTTLARELAASAGALPAAEIVDEPPPLPDEEDAPKIAPAPRPTPSPRPSSAPRGATDIRGDERGKVPTMSSRPPITETWWFWTGAFLIVAGGAGGTAYTLLEPDPEVVVEPDGWAVRIVTAE